MAAKGSLKNDPSQVPSIGSTFSVHLQCNFAVCDLPSIDLLSSANAVSSV